MFMDSQCRYGTALLRKRINSLLCHIRQREWRTWDPVTNRPAYESVVMLFSRQSLVDKRIPGYRFTYRPVIGFHRSLTRQVMAPLFLTLFCLWMKRCHLLTIKTKSGGSLCVGPEETLSNQGNEIVNFIRWFQFHYRESLQGPVHLLSVSQYGSSCLLSTY